jgi:hypothetical protein
MSNVKLEGFMLKDGTEIIVDENQTVTNVNGEILADG